MQAKVFQVDRLADKMSDDVFHSIYDQDNITDEWLLVGYTWPVISILTTYVLLVLKIGPQLMKDREPFKLKSVMRIYNMLQVLANSFLVVRFFSEKPSLITVLMNTACSLQDHEQYNDQKKLMLFYGWIFVVLKLCDLLDTVFLVLRKKSSHITFLHIYHHVAMVFFSWVTFKYSKSHHGVVPAMINIVVHSIMYGYYLLATFPGLKPYLWWKKHLTKVQLGQFLLIIAYLALLYYHDCPIPRVFTYIWIFNVSLICALFINFYIKAYLINDDASYEKDPILQKSKN